MNEPVFGRRPRIALYSHDAVGLGHTRRNLAIAGALSRSLPGLAILVLSGAPEAAAFPRPAGCDVVGLPALTKGASSGYAARTLPVSRTEVLALRSSVLTVAVTAFAPDLLIVDKHPRGVAGELTAALRTMASRPGTRVVLGLRDVLDGPAAAAAEWQTVAGTAALRRFYDAVWVYGDPAVHDPTAALDLPADLAARVHHLGYLGRRPGIDTPAHPLGGDRYVLGLCGGGVDGAELADAFAAQKFPRGTCGVLVAGPHLPEAARARLHARAGERDDLTVLDFVADLTPWLDHAAAVVSMGGYNTVCEVATRPVPHLVVPRMRPRTEQLIRARALAGTSVLEMLEPDQLSAASLGRWIRWASALPRPVVKAGVDLDGLDRVGAYTTALLSREETYGAASRGRHAYRLRPENVPAAVGDVRRQRDHRP